MDLPSIDKKLREAAFFLSKMRHQESPAFGDKEPFDFYLSAFLSAGRSVDYRLLHEHKPNYRPWRTAWDAARPPAERELMKFLIDDRNVEVHARGSTRTEDATPIAVGNTYRDPSGSLEASGPPGAGPTIIKRPAYYFTIGKAVRKATDACTEYLRLLEHMVDDFKAAYP